MKRFLAGLNFMTLVQIWCLIQTPKHSANTIEEPLNWAYPQKDCISNVLVIFLYSHITGIVMTSLSILSGLTPFYNFFGKPNTFLFFYNFDPASVGKLLCGISKFYSICILITYFFYVIIELHA
jgi:hypothetical protein